MAARKMTRILLVAAYGLLGPWPRAAAQSAAPAVTKTATAKLPLADRFTTVAAAQAHCPGDVVVWSTMTKTKAYHLSASRYYGKTKHGAYACQKDAIAFGFHASKE